MKTVVVLNHEQMGHGDPALGQKILATFLRKGRALKGLSAIVFYNSGVKLLVRGSPVLAELHQLHEAGVDLRPCGTCVDFYGLRQQIDLVPPSNMDEIIRELDGADKVVTL